MRLEDLGLQNPISVGYYDPFSIYSSVKDDFESKFPLTNLHWKYHPLKPVKLIPLLPVQLVEEVPHSSGKQKQPIVYDNVYLRLIFVRADNLEVYRSQVRPLIQAWLGDLVEGREVSWAIVLMSSGIHKEKSLTLMKKSVYEKLVTDFSKNGKHQVLKSHGDLDDIAADEEEFVFRLGDKYNSDIEKLELFNHITTEFKGLILKTFDRRYNSYNEELDSIKETKSSDPELLIRELYYKLKLVDIVSDMRFFDESLELYEEVGEALKELSNSVSHAFETGSSTFLNTVDHPDFNPEKTVLSRELLNQFDKYLSEGVPINLQQTSLSIFLGASILLQSLANSAASLSLSSIYILHLFQKVINFVNEVSGGRSDDASILEWSCSLIDFYLKLPLTHKLVELSSEGEEGAILSSSSGIFEYIGELKLVKRGLAGKLAKLKGIETPEIGFLLEDVSLDDSNGSTHKAQEYTFKDQALEEITASQNNFDAFFEELTMSAIQDFAYCERKKTIDLLSVDLAVLHYKKGNYQQAYDVLLTSYEYFIENGWSFMGGMLLEIYIHCLEKLETKDEMHILDTNLKLLATLKHETSSVGGINRYEIVKSNELKKKLLEHVYDIALRLEEPVSVSLDILFETSVDPFIESTQDGKGKYSIELMVKNHLGMDFRLDKLTLELEECGSTQSQSIKFSRENIQLSEKPQLKIQLFTNDFKNSYFRPTLLVYKPCDKLTFVQMYLTEGLTDEVLADETVVHNKSTVDLLQPGAENGNSLGISVPGSLDLLKGQIYMYGDSANLNAKFRVPTKIELNASDVELAVNLGNSSVTDLSIEIQPLDVGVEIVDGLSLLKQASLEPYSELTKKIPYKYFGDRKILQFAATIKYDVDDVPHTYYVQQDVDNSLKILISVQDIFREKSIYSKFQIGCAQSRTPIRIVGSEFKCNSDKYLVASLTCDISEQNTQLVFGEQPAFMFYRITPKSENVSSSDTLDLTITYSNLQNECEAKVLGLQEEYFQSFELLRYSTLFTELVKLLQFDLNEYAINSVIQIKNAGHVRTLFQESIETHVRTEKDKAELICCIDMILKSTIPVEDVTFVRQQLYIPVAVPILDILHNVEFTYGKKMQHLVGEPIDMKLQITSSMKWSEENDVPREVLASSSPTGKGAAKQQMFQFIVHHEDNWLLSGLKQHAFPVLGPNSKTEFDLTLIPLNVGKLPLPRVTIKPVEQNDRTSTDTVQENGLETVLVVPELQSITFSF